MRLALLNRSRDQPWECTETEFADAASVLERLYAAAGSATDTTAAVEEVLGLLVTELDVPGALELALDQGGQAARFLIQTLELRDAPPP